MAERDSHQVRLHPREATYEISQGRTVLVTGLKGMIERGSTPGLYVHKTRMISQWEYLIDGQHPALVAASSVEQHSWLGYYIQLAPGVHIDEQDRGSGEMEQSSEDTLELRVSRFVGFGVHEDIDFTNYTRGPVDFKFQIEVDADFLDQEETVRERQQFGRRTRAWRRSERGWELSFDYRARHHYSHQGDRGLATIHRGIVVAVQKADSPPTCSSRRISFRIRLEPHRKWHACLDLTPHVEGEPMFPQYACGAFFSSDNQFDRQRGIFLDNATRFSSPRADLMSHVVTEALEQAKLDLVSLRLHDLDEADDAWTMAAGLPIFVALFGRDTLTASWEAGMASSQMMRGTLHALARYQGLQDNPWRDEMPGRMLHEAHTGPLAMLGFNPRKRYYGSATTSGFYPVVLCELWHWTGDRQLVAPLVEPALKGLACKDKYERKDGLYRYLSRSQQGTKNQGWKDSGDAIVYEDGRQVEPPISLCEEQGFVYAAKLHMSELLWWLDRKDEACRLYQEAEELKKRVNEAFWMDDEGFYAMGLDAERRPIRSIGSDPGHLLATGIADESRVAQVAARMMSDELFSGWGVRTLSAKHPAYNPFSYHRGSVWPVEQGSFAMGFMRFGLWEHLHRLVRAQFELTSIFDYFRPPEVFSGHPRDGQHPFPALYPKTCWPQAWSSSSLFAMVQAMLGLYPYAPLHMLLVDPHLPGWLPEITLSNLHVGQAVADIRFFRKGSGDSEYEILEKRGTLHVLRQPSPWSLTAGFVVRVSGALSSLLPGR